MKDRERNAIKQILNLSIHILLLQVGSKKKNVTLNPKDYNDKCFQYPATVALSRERVGGHRERVSNIKPFRNKNNWERIEYPSGKDDWVKFETQTIKINHTFNDS